MIETSKNRNKILAKYNLSTNKNIHYFFNEYILSPFFVAVLNKITSQSWITPDMQISYMPDSHPTESAVVGLTIQCHDKVNVDFVSADIGCGVAYYKLPKDIKLTATDFLKVDKALRLNGVNQLAHDKPVAIFPRYHKLKCFNEISLQKANAALMTLGNGNHFIEIDYDKTNNDYYIVVHSGSRNLGGQVFKYYKKQQNIKNEQTLQNELIKSYIKTAKENHLEHTISAYIKFIRTNIKMPNDYITGQIFDDYIADMQVVNEYAFYNRELIISLICQTLNAPFDKTQIKTSIHNIVGKDKILRKGAIQAVAGQEVIIPLNMATGCLIGVAKGLPDWNYSCPHGAGRVYSRHETRNHFTMDDFTKQTKSIISTTINENTLDELPSAYKSPTEIIENTQNIEIINYLSTVYNFKCD